jgi:hypothetical protein
VGRNGDGVTSTLVGPRNFSLDKEERLRALVSGPPAFALRRRKMEDLEASIVNAIADHEFRAGGPLDLGAPPAGIARALATLRRLVEIHNRYYPIEATLPTDVATGELMDRGKPWEPLPVPTLETLSAQARSRRS